MRAWWQASCAMAGLLVLAGCDPTELGAGKSSPATTPPLQAAPNLDMPAAYVPGSPSLSKISSAPGGAATDLRDAVAAVSPDGTDRSGAVFDGSRPAGSAGATASLTTAAGGNALSALADASGSSDVPVPAARSETTSSALASNAAAIGTGQVPIQSAAQTGVGTTASASAPTNAPSQVSAGGVSVSRPRLLLVGDSHSVGAFGGELASDLSRDISGSKVAVYAVSGSSPFWFAPGARVSGPGPAARRDTTGVAAQGVAKLSELLTPDTGLVVFALGTNQIDWKAVKGGRMALYGLDSGVTLAREARANGSACVWIGPPDMNGYQGTPKAAARAAVAAFDAQMGAKLSGLCRYVSSDDKTSYRGGDGIHYFPGPAQRWADAVAGQVRP